MKPPHRAILQAVAVLLAQVISATTLAAAPPQEPPSAGSGAGSRDLLLAEHPIAILPFRERGAEVEDLGGQVADMVFAKLVVDPSLFLVDREEVERTLAEAELNLSGIVKPDEAIAVGQWTGARLIVTGSVFQVGETVYLVAKIIGSETSRVMGASAKGPAVDGIEGLADQLAGEVLRTIRQRSALLVAEPDATADRVVKLKRVLPDSPRPTLHISIEERHVGEATLDPAAETEMLLMCRELGFSVVDAQQGDTHQAEFLIRGEGVSEFARRHGNLISVKARLEVKVIERSTGKVVAADRQTRVMVDLVEQIAGKQALQQAAADIAERVLPKLARYRSDAD